DADEEGHQQRDHVAVGDQPPAAVPAAVVAVLLPARAVMGAALRGVGFLGVFGLPRRDWRLGRGGVWGSRHGGCSFQTFAGAGSSWRAWGARKALSRVSMVRGTSPSTSDTRPVIISSRSSVSSLLRVSSLPAI